MSVKLSPVLSCLWRRVGTCISLAGKGKDLFSLLDVNVLRNFQGPMCV